MTNVWDAWNAKAVLGSVYDDLVEMVALGAETYEEILDHFEDPVRHDSLANYVDGEENLPTDSPDVQSKWIAHLLDAEFAAHLERQTAWSGTTAGDLLPALFQELDGQGFRWRVDEDGCYSCPLGALALRSDPEDTDPPTRALLHLHEYECRPQSFGAGSRLRHRIGVVLPDGERDPERLAGFAGEIVATMERHGLAVEFQPHESYPLIRMPELVNRRVGGLAAHPGAAG
jgi:hypothetical protein